MYKVMYEDDISVSDGACEFATIEEAEKNIKEEFERVKEFFHNYKSGDFPNEDGHLVTEIWESGGDSYARWIRDYKITTEECINEMC